MKLEIPECIDKPVENALTNITDKPSKEVGEIFNDLLRMIFGVVHFIAEKQQIKYKYALEQYEKRCEEKIKSIPESRRAEPDLQIIGGALENSRFCIESETLREMFANLIAGSLDIDKKPNIRPSFSYMIQQMSPSEASIFATLIPGEAFPMVEYNVPLSRSTYKLLATNVLMALDENLDLDALYQRTIDLSLLEKLGLIVSTFDKITDEEKYQRYFHNNVYTELMEELNQNIVIKRGLIYLSPLGIDFWNICCADSAIPKIEGIPASFL